MNPWLLVVRGVLAFLLGLVLVIWPGATLAVILIFFPLFCIIDGGAAIIIGSKTSKEGRWFSFIPMGILEILIGIFVLIWPDITIVALAFLMGLWAFVLGLGEFFIAVSANDMKSGAKLAYGVGGVLTFILGILLLVYPLTTAEALIWLLGLFFLFYGIILFITGYWGAAKLSGKELEAAK